MQLITLLKQWLEYLGGSSDDSPAPGWLPLSSVLWGLWWCMLLLLIMMFCGQTSKFIYIDF